MNKYEYKVLQESTTKSFSLEDINKLGQEGWKVVWWIVPAGGYETILLERIIEEKND